MIKFHYIVFVAFIILGNVADDITGEEAKTEEGGVPGIDDVNTDLPILNTDTLTNPEEKSRWTKTGNKFKEILIRSLLLAGKPFLGHPIGIFTAAVGVVLGLTTGGEKSIWEQIEGKIKLAIGKEITKYHFDSLKGTWERMNYKMKKGEDFDLNDLEYIVTQKHNFFPQAQTTVVFTSQFISSIQAYLIYLSAGYLELIRQKKITKCSWSKELAVLRKDIIMAAKSMHRKRYEQIEGYSYGLGHVPAGHKPRPSCDELGRSNQCNTYRLLKYKDKLTEWISPNEWLPHVENRVLKKIRDETNEMIMKVVNDFNDLYLTEDICQPGCDIPDKITEDEITFDYPKGCYGTNTDENKPCPLPCDYYGWSDLFCPTTPLTEMLWRGSALGYMDHNWRYCSKASWDRCMPVGSTEQAYFKGKKTKKAKKAKKAKKEKKAKEEKND